MKNFLLNQGRKFWNWQRHFPIGWRIVVLAVILVGGRYLWVCVHRPAHRLALADAYSINLFYGSPQPDSTGRQLACVGTADHGFAVFLVNTATGQKKSVREENALGPWGSYFDLKVWPWSPDDRLFIYSTNNQFYLCDAATGTVKGSVNLPVEVAALAWVKPDEFVCIGRDEALYRVRKKADGLWQAGDPLRMDRALASSENAPGEGAAKAFDGMITTKWYDNNRPGPWWLEYQFAGGVPRRVTHYRLTSGNDAPERDPKDWELQASNDGVHWVTLDARSGETFNSRQQTKTYQISTPAAYQAYRLAITKQAGNAENNLQLSEFSLLAANTNGQLEELTLRRNPLVNPASLQAMDSNTLAWASDDCLWSLNLASNAPVMLVNCREAISENTRLQSVSYSQTSGQFLLSCAQDGKPLLYQFDPQAPAQALSAIPAGAGVDSGVWLGGTAQKNGGFVGRQKQVLVLERENKPEVPATLSWASIDTMTVTADGRQIFFFGTTTNEPAAGVWQYDLETGRLRSVIPYAEHPSPYARKIEPLNDFILTASGKYTIYLPADFYRHPHRKYPLVIGDTDFGFAASGAYGRMWAPAVASCNAFVVIVNRKDWFGGLDQWGERVAAAVDELSVRLPIDQDRMFLFGVSAETTYLGKFLNQSAPRWRGAILLNPSGLPELSGTSTFQPMPKILISAGELEGREKELKEFQQKMLNSGVLVDLAIAPGEKHHLIGNLAQRQRTRAMIDFIFGD